MTEQTPRVSDGSPRRMVLLAAWLLAGLCLFSLLGSNPCQRTQEARVLVSAREMYEQGGERWLLPTCDGELRLRKPPLPYWMSAAGFALSGNVSEWSGRTPAALCAWLMLGLTYVAGSRAFSWRLGLLASGFLLSCYLLFRYGRLAETDIPSAMFVTLSVWLFWEFVRAGRARIWLALAGGAAAGGAMLAKGAPGAFPFVFVLLFAVAQRKWSRLALGLGAGIVAAAVVAAPWYVYVWAKGHWHILQSELDVVAGGDDHAGTIFDLFVELLQATLPWTVLWLSAIVVALGVYRRRMATLMTRRPVRALRHAFDALRRSPGLQGVFSWLLAILVPLSLSGNKQLHYVMPALAPLMLLAAWVVDRAIRNAGRPIGVVVGRLMLITLGVFVIAGIGTVAAGILEARGIQLAPGDDLAIPAIVLGATLAIAGGISLVLQRRGGLWAGALGAIATSAIVAPMLTGWLGPRVEAADIRDAASGVIQHAGSGPMVFWRCPPSLPLVFQLKRIVPMWEDSNRLKKIARNPNATVLIITRPGEGPAQMPEPWQLVWRGGPKGHHTQVFRPTAGRGPASTAPAR